MNRIILMSLFKGGFGAVMATEAERRLRLEQKEFLVGTVGEMARCTTLRPHFMDHFLFIILLFMTLITSFVTLCFQQATGLRSMGIMTLDAFSSL
jgi:hypothetical protein